MKRLFGLFGGANASASTAIAGSHNAVFNCIVQGGATVPLPMRRTQWTPHLQDGAGVAALLGWQSRLVPLLGREAAMEELRAWRDDERFPRSFKLMSAPGGAGKTRLAAEFSEDAEGAWQHGWVSLRDFERAEGLAWQGRWLLIVDYPEHEPAGLERLARLLSQLSPAEGQRLRVLLLVREAEGVERVMNEQRCGAFMAQRLALPELPPPEGWSLFSQALADLKQRTQAEPPLVTQQAFDEWQASDTLHRSPLLLLAQAIYWMSEKAAAEAACHRWLKGSALLAALIGIERTVWQRAERGHSAPVGSVEATMAWATLCGGLTDAQINQYLAPAWGWSSDGVSALHRSLKSLGHGAEEHTCAPLGPDLLAAQFITEAWNQPAWQGQAVRDAGLAEKLLALNDRPAFAAQLNCLHMLAYDQTVRLAACAPSDGHSIESLLLRWAGSAPILEWALCDVLIANVGWTAFGRMCVVLGQKAVDGMAKEMPDDQRAWLLNQWAGNLSHSGQAALALVPAGEAVEVFRRLAVKFPRIYDSDLAMSLSNLAKFLSETGDRQGALIPSQEALSIFQRLPARNSAADESNLAASLNNTASFLSGAGDQSAAIAASQQALLIYQRLATEDPSVYEPSLAGSLSNTAAILSRSGEYRRALDFAKDAVEIRRRLARINPSVYEPKLGGSLNNIAQLMFEAGEGTGALTAAREAVEIYGRLAQMSPTAYEPNLAQCLNNLARILSGLGHLSEALMAAKRATNVYSRMAQVNPAAHEADWATCLTNLASFLSEANAPREALAPAWESVEIFQRLAEVHPAVYEPGLGHSLNNLAYHLSEVDERDGACLAAQAAKRIFRRLAQESPITYEPEFATSLCTWGIMLSESGAREEAPTVLQEAVEILRRLASSDPMIYESKLAKGLETLMRCLAAAGQRDEALKAGREALALFAALAQHMPAVYERYRAMTAEFIQTLEAD